MPFIFAPPAQPVVPVQDERYEFFPIRRVYGVARNYVNVTSDEQPVPLIFMKPADAVIPVADGETLKLPYPVGTVELIHEIELVAAIGEVAAPQKGGRHLTVEEAQASIWGWGVGLDLTRKAVGDEQPGAPWDLKKAFDMSAPISHLRPAYRSPMPAPADIWLWVNNQKRQSGSTKGLIWSPAETISRLSEYVSICSGDLIFTGTPPGAAAILPGDRLEGGVNGVGIIKVEVTPAL